ncbi:MAG: P1 family peptidase [bacterium]|nr:P1 family peptidase [bacterium]
MFDIEPAKLEDLAAFKFGNASNSEAGTGCTVILALDGATAGVDVRGAAPATRETDLLRPENTVQQIHAVVLSGGSAFGLAAATGVMEALEAEGIGFELIGFKVPIVCGASVFDLLVGDGSVRPDAAMGKVAVAAALAGEPFKHGNVGAGAGCTVSKLLGLEGLVKSGLGIAAYRFGDLIVGAIVAANACGCVVDRNGSFIASPTVNGERLTGMMAVAAAAQAAQSQQPSDAPTNTTIGCVVTNAKLSKPQASRVATTTHDAYARAIVPVHTSNDGDAIFCMASGEVEADSDLVAALACEAMQDAIIDSVKSAESAYGIPAWK